jgi:hypothetical protein
MRIKLNVQIAINYKSMKIPAEEQLGKLINLVIN